MPIRYSNLLLEVDEYGNGTIVGETDAPARPSKYNNRPVDVDGFHFDSEAEAMRFSELQILQSADIIRDLEVHPVYVLLDGFRNREGEWVEPIKYEADFRYVDVATGATVVEDVKGVQTAVFKLKHKLLMSRYPDLDFRIVQK